MITFENVTKLYGTVSGVNDVSLRLGPGAYGLLGPNGSGKTTLLNLLTGQLRPSMGTARLFEADPFYDSAPLAKIGLCPAMDILPTDVTGLTWVTYMVQLQGYERPAALQRANAALDRVGLLDARTRDIAGYSRGMKQRVKLAQAIAHEPEFLILDEPLAGLDPVARRDMTQLFREWIQANRSILMASHILHEVESVATDYLLIHGGRLLASGSTHDVYEMLEDVPRQVDLLSNEAAKLAVITQQQEIVDAVQFHPDGDGITVLTRQPQLLFQQLPHWLDEHNVSVREVRSSDESLQALFETLMKIHRGVA